MTERIFYFEGSDGGFERWLEVEEDGSVIYSTSPNRYAYLGGARGEYLKLSAAEAKARWPQYAEEIDAAAARAETRRSS